MQNKLYVGNLPFSLSEEELRNLFEAVGTVEEARVCVDRDTQRPRGFGFVTMNTESAAELAIARLSGHRVGGRELVVNFAREKEFSGGRR